MVPPSPPRSRVKCEIFRTNVLEDGWGYRPQAASVSEPRARPSENMAQIRGLVPVLPSQRNSDLGFCHPREPKCPCATAPRGPNRAFAPIFPSPQRIQPACPERRPAGTRASRPRPKQNRPRAASSGETGTNHGGAKEVSERRRGAAIAPPSDQAALGPCRVRNKGQDGVHRRRAASVPNCERQRAASTKKEAARRRGPPGQKEGGCDSLRSRFLLFRDKAGK